MDDEQQYSVYKAYGMPAHFAGFVHAVFHEQIARVVKHPCRYVKADAMLPQVQAVLFGVPFYPHPLHVLYYAERSLYSPI